MSFNTERKQEINWITAEAMKLHESGYGTMHDCVTRAKDNWKREKKIRERIAIEKVFDGVGYKEKPSMPKPSFKPPSIKKVAREVE